MRAAIAIVVFILGLFASPSNVRPDDPFGAETIALTYGPLVAIWQALREGLARDDVLVAACDHGAIDGCVPAVKLLAVVTEARHFEGKALLGHLNRSINLLIKPAPGLWTGALDALRLGNGDCKSYSIAKYLALREAGVAADHVRLVILHDGLHNIDHMIVAVYDAQRWIVLDSLTMALLQDTEEQTYVPLFVMDEQGIRAYRTAPVG
jgi:predicted transglutaminase-like cysteine proteinase